MILWQITNHGISAASIVLLVLDTFRAFARALEARDSAACLATTVTFERCSTRYCLVGLVLVSGSASLHPLTRRLCQDGVRQNNSPPQRVRSHLPCFKLANQDALVN